MPTFGDHEKQRYAAQKPALFSPDACAPGSYKHVPRTFCLADGHAAENLYPRHRAAAIQYFRDRNIHWHDGIGDQPSNHLCCSQSACVNALWPLTSAPALLVAAFQPYLPQIVEALPFVADRPLAGGAHPFLAFEWIGTRNYLGEHGARTRGAYATSADFVFRFRRDDGRTQLVLGEWKYTEEYRSARAKPEKTLTTQQAIYRSHYEAWRAEGADLPPYAELFVAPFYQLMRLTLLARAMEADRRAGGPGELGADLVTVLHVVPRANRAFAASLHGTALPRYGSTPSAIWSALAPERFVAVPAEDLLASLHANAPAHLRPWGDYLLQRYGWWQPGVGVAKRDGASA